MVNKLNHKIENFIRELETVKKNQVKIQELKNIKTKINQYEATSSRLGELLFLSFT